MSLSDNSVADECSKAMKTLASWSVEDYHRMIEAEILGDRRGEAVKLNNIGGVYSDLGEKQQVLSFFNQALPLYRAVGAAEGTQSARSGEADTLGNLAFLKRNQGNLSEALTQIEAAIDILEDLRTKVASPELRASYFATVQGDYEFYIDLLMQLHRQDPSQGYDARALHASERARARTLLELLTEANADIRTGVDPQLLQQERRLQNQLVHLGGNNWPA